MQMEAATMGTQRLGMLESQLETRSPVLFSSVKSLVDLT